MNSVLRITAALIMFCAGPASAQSTNPYMPGGSGGSSIPGLSDDQRQQMIQNAITAIEGSGAQGPAVQTEVPVATPAPAQVSPPDDSIEKLKLQQAQSISDIARERSDREFDIKALRDVMQAKIDALQKKIDDQQRQIDLLGVKPPGNRN